MKKTLFTALLAAVLIVALSITVFAAAPTASLSVNTSSVSANSTVTITVNVSNCSSTSLGIIPSYDVNSFELVSGQWLLSGAVLSDFSDGVGVIAYSSPYSFSGSVFSFVLRVKSGVVPKAYTISCEVQAEGYSVVLPSTVVTVVCNHSYGAWTKVDDNTHSRTCSICSATETVAHTWNGGEVTKAATCKEAGEKTYTCTACNATKKETIPKTNDHNYGAWTKVDDNNHKHTCSVCGKEETSGHTWNDGAVTKAATCKEAGEKTYTCTACNATKKETIPKANDHTYGAWTKVDDNNHKHTCMVCGKEETASHSWDGGKITKQPNCKETGVKTYTCSVCHGTKTEEIAKTTTHTFGRWEKVSDMEHKRTCTVCGVATETASHTWNQGVVTEQPTCAKEGTRTYTCTACAATKKETITKTTDHKFGAWEKKNGTNHKHTCTVCGKEETEAHAYGADWQKDASSHYHVCPVCGDKKDVANHVPGPAATESAPQTCTVCNYIIAQALGHTHNWSTTWTSDASGHWYTCSGCNEKKDAAAHVYDHGCDSDCNVCGYKRVTEHDFELKHDETSHWQECRNCGEIKDKEDHVPGPEATEDNAQVCLVCDYEIEPAKIPESTESESDDETKDEDETTEETTDEPETTASGNDGKGGKGGSAGIVGSPLPWILGGLGVLAVVGIVIFFLLRKNRKKEA